MNAHESGAAAGLTAMLMYPGVNRATFQKLAWASARKSYKRLEVQTNFVDGFLARYVEPHAKDCQCDECQRIRADIVTY